ncbi:hypothetical protein FNV43_RR18198 [Rhamnella rubrinervis]|uniref:NAC domain-containing protein n=1 Tax=Rhamnella rubrinervis TaxID=2594499 RepID=A0A8K0E5T6_9ROSA|nr:hypothetical protein FNV43_RR18198 [Rhamnella rubrinervis]
MELPPGFRFHPTDEELITHYLSSEVLNSRFCAKIIGEADLNKCEPWNLPWLLTLGYWKATGKDKEIFKAKSLVGMKKTLVFYRGRAPKAQAFLSMLSTFKFGIFLFFSGWYEAVDSWEALLNRRCPTTKPLCRDFYGNFTFGASPSLPAPICTPSLPAPIGMQ